MGHAPASVWHVRTVARIISATIDEFDGWLYAIRTDAESARVWHAQHQCDRRRQSEPVRAAIARSVACASNAELVWQPGQPEFAVDSVMVWQPG
jgi:hypothetical protein